MQNINASHIYYNERCTNTLLQNIWQKIISLVWNKTIDLVLSCHNIELQTEHLWHFDAQYMDIFYISINILS